MFELEGCHDFSGGVLADLNQTGWSRTAAVSEFEPDQTGTEADDNAFDKNGQVDAQEIPPYESSDTASLRNIKNDGKLPSGHTLTFRPVMRYYNINSVFVKKLESGTAECGQGTAGIQQCSLAFAIPDFFIHYHISPFVSEFVF